MGMKKITELRGQLLEGCVWDAWGQVLYFIDIECRKVYRCVPETGNLEEFRMRNYVGCVVPEKAGTLLVAAADGLYRLSFWERTAIRIMESRLEEGMRFNDGKCDERGRLWIGSMSVLQDKQSVGKGKLYCLESDACLNVYSGYTIPNGMCWDKDGSIFYHIDTHNRCVDAYRVEKGVYLKERRTVINLNEEQGVPDGMCKDEEGKLWIAMWGQAQVIRCDPETGKVMERMSVPDRNVSCCTFGGKDMDQMFITTARDETGAGGEVYQTNMNVRGEKVNYYGE